MKHTKRILALILALVTCLCLPIPAFAAQRAETFTDFDRTAWYAKAVSDAVDNGLLYGKGGGRLDPNGYLTRGEMAAIINRAFGAYKGADISKFTDVSRNKWYYEDVQKAYQMGTFVGASATTMRPDDTISRQEIFTVVCRALQLDTAKYANTSMSKFRDASTIADWALPYLKAMTACSYVHGRPTGLAPLDNITRAEFCQLFFNVIQHYLGAGTYTEDISGNVLVNRSGVEFKDMTVDGDLILGCGVGDSKVTLSNVTVKGRLVVWGGGTRAVYCNDETNISELVVCRVDGPVKVIFDQESSLLVYETIDVRITDKARAFPETEVIFLGVEEMKDVQGGLNDLVDSSQIHATVSDHLYAMVDETLVKGILANSSTTDDYRFTITRKDTGDEIAEPIILAAGKSVDKIMLKEILPFGNYDCLVTVTVLRNNAEVGTLELETRLHVGYLWAFGGQEA